MKKKRFLTALTSLLLAFGVCAMSACEGVTVTPDGDGGVVVKPINPGNITVTPDGNGGFRRILRAVRDRAAAVL